MKQNSHEHQEFEKHCKAKGLNREMHPLHLLYLNEKTAKALDHFQAGYAAGFQHVEIPLPRQSDLITYEFWRGHEHDDRAEARGAGGIYCHDLPASLTNEQIKVMVEFISDGVLGMGNGAIQFRPQCREVGEDAPNLAFYDASNADSFNQAKQLNCVTYLNGNFYGTTGQLGDIDGIVDCINGCLKLSDIECFIKNAEGEYIPIGSALINGISPWS